MFRAQSSHSRSHSESEHFSPHLFPEYPSQHPSSEFHLPPHLLRHLLPPNPPSAEHKLYKLFHPLPALPQPAPIMEMESSKNAPLHPSVLIPRIPNSNSSPTSEFTAQTLVERALSKKQKGKQKQKQREEQKNGGQTYYCSFNPIELVTFKKPFIITIFVALENSQIYGKGIEWDETGTMVLVHNNDFLTMKVLPPLFGHACHKTLIHQFKLYTFTKTDFSKSSSTSGWTHPSFRSDSSIDELKTIVARELPVKGTKRLKGEGVESPIAVAVESKSGKKRKVEVREEDEDEDDKDDEEDEEFIPKSTRRKSSVKKREE